MLHNTLDFIADNYQPFLEPQKQVQKGIFSTDFHTQSLPLVSVEFVVFLQGLFSGAAPSPGQPEHIPSDSNGTSHEQAFHQASIAVCHRDNLFFMYNWFVPALKNVFRNPYSNWYCHIIKSNTFNLKLIIFHYSTLVDKARTPA